ncbi:MAG: hypothetical protein H7237_12005 [Alkalinema sp. FL-bin-369]|nr:hypothetical protein [Leptolyngbyaceae cyanobacterium LF-bin-369]
MNATQNHIQHLTAQINPLHQTSRDERIQLAEWEDERPFSILGELELLAGLLQGYAGQLMTDRIEQPQSAIAQLQQRNPFEIPELSAWYLTHGKDYPKLCRYLELLDYLRLSLLGAIQQTALQAA